MYNKPLRAIVCVAYPAAEQARRSDEVIRFYTLQTSRVDGAEQTGGHHGTGRMWPRLQIHPLHLQPHLCGKCQIRIR